MAKFQRETATEKAELPHEFTEHDEQDERSTRCYVCTGGARDPRHLAWEQEQLSNIERAQSDIRREMGS